MGTGITWNGNQDGNGDTMHQGRIRKTRRVIDTSIRTETTHQYSTEHRQTV